MLRRAATLTSPGESELLKVDWAQVDVLYLRGFAERGKALRRLFRGLKAVVPCGREVHFELATTGFTYFRRSGHVRNCESLCYEVASYLGRDFECRFILTTLQHNFVLGYRRTGELQRYPLERVCVIGANEAGAARAFVSALGATAVDLETGTADAILIVGDESALAEPERWREAYSRHGAACFTGPGDRVLDGALLLDVSDYVRVANGWVLDGTSACRQVFESALIFAGIYPFNLRTTE